MNRPSTIWESTDSKLLDWLIPFSLRRDPKIIIDPCFGRGRFWKGSRYLPILIKSDLNPFNSGVVKADFRCLPIKSNSIDVCVFDPPHISESGKYSLISNACGFGDDGEENISDLF